jgi:hypothetical protein
MPQARSKKKKKPAPQPTAEQRAYYYRKYRQHQHEVYVSGGGSVDTYPSGRTEVSYGSAPYGEHALSAFVAARRHLHFLRVNR